MHGVAFAGYWVLQVWVLLALLRALLSWFPIGYDSPWAKVQHLLARITEPVIAPVRRAIPAAGGIDVAFVVVVIVVQIFAGILHAYAG